MTDESWEIHTRTVLLLLPPLPWHGEKHLFTCMNAEHETRQRTDRWVAPLALEVIHHPPYPTCQICWTCRLLLPEPLRAEMKAFSFQETSRGSQRRDKRFCFFYLYANVCHFLNKIRRQQSPSVLGVFAHSLYCTTRRHNKSHKINIYIFRREREAARLVNKVRILCSALQRVLEPVMWADSLRTWPAVQLSLPSGPHLKERRDLQTKHNGSAPPDLYYADTLLIMINHSVPPMQTRIFWGVRTLVLDEAYRRVNVSLHVTEIQSTELQICRSCRCFHSFWRATWLWALEIKEFVEQYFSPSLLL